MAAKEHKLQASEAAQQARIEFNDLIREKQRAEKEAALALKQS